MLVGVTLQTNRPTVLFDVDGTILDSFPGIREGFLRGLAAIDVAPPDEAFIAKIPGPPMRESYEKAGCTPAQVDAAMQVYSDFMSTDGWQQFTVFDGMAELIAQLDQDGFRVGTATSKSETFAELALKRAGIWPHLDFLGAADHERGRSTKIAVLEYVHDTFAPKRPIMVGDRTHDFTGAAHFDIPSVAVTWGYGDAEEWAQATHTAQTATELKEILYAY